MTTEQFGIDAIYPGLAVWMSIRRMEGGFIIQLHDRVQSPELPAYVVAGNQWALDQLYNMAVGQVFTLPGMTYSEMVAFTETNILPTGYKREAFFWTGIEK